MMNDLGRADFRSPPPTRPDGLYRHAVAEHRVVPYLVDFARADVQSWRGLEADGFASNLRFGPAVSLLDEGAELVDREIMLHAVTELPSDVPAIVAERFRRVSGALAAVLVLQCLRQVPVIERGKRLDAGRLQFVHQPVVEVDPLRVWGARAFGEDPGPGDREPIRGRADRLHQRHVLLVPVVVVVGEVTGVAVLDLAGRVREGVPDGRALAVLVPGPLDLVRRRGDAPVEAVRKPSRRSRLGTWSNIGGLRGRSAAERGHGHAKSRCPGELDRVASGERRVVGFHSTSPRWARSASERLPIGRPSVNRNARLTAGTVLSGP